MAQPSVPTKRWWQVFQPNHKTSKGCTREDTLALPSSACDHFSAMSEQDFRSLVQQKVMPYYLCPFKGDPWKPLSEADRFEPHKRPLHRVDHGAMHASRVAIHAKALIAYYKKYKHIDFTAEQERLIVLAALFHDTARQGRMIDYWDEESADNFKRFLREQGYTDENVIDFYASAISQKDDFQHSRNIAMKIVHDADCLEVMRVRFDFNVQYLECYQEIAKDNPEAMNVLKQMVFEARQMIYDQDDMFLPCLVQGFEDGRGQATCYPRLRRHFNIGKKRDYEHSDNCLEAVLQDLGRYPTLKSLYDGQVHEVGYRTWPLRKLSSDHWKTFRKTFMSIPGVVLSLLTLGVAPLLGAMAVKVSTLFEVREPKRPTGLMSSTLRKISHEHYRKVFALYLEHYGSQKKDTDKIAKSLAEHCVNAIPLRGPLNFHSRIQDNQHVKELLCYVAQVQEITESIGDHPDTEQEFHQLVAQLKKPKFIRYEQQEPAFIAYREEARKAMAQSREKDPESLLRLILSGNAAGRILNASATSPGGLDFDMEQLVTPMTSRPIRPAWKKMGWRNKMRDQRTNVYYERKELSYEERKAQEQEPLKTRPSSLEEYESPQNRSVTMKDALRGRKRNTVFTKKRSHFLFRSDAKYNLFYSMNPVEDSIQVGMIYDVQETERKGDRYIWRKDSGSIWKFWTGAGAEVKDWTKETPYRYAPKGDKAVFWIDQRGKGTCLATLKEQLAKEVQAGAPPKLWTELLVGDSLKALKGLFAVRNTLPHRLALINTYVRLKNDYGLDLPLVIADGENPPFIYTQEQMTVDLLLAARNRLHWKTKAWFEGRLREQIEFDALLKKFGMISDFRFQDQNRIFENIGRLVGRVGYKTSSNYGPRPVGGASTQHFNVLENRVFWSSGRKCLFFGTVGLPIVLLAYFAKLLVFMGQRFFGKREYNYKPSDVQRVLLSCSRQNFKQSVAELGSALEEAQEHLADSATALQESLLLQRRVSREEPALDLTQAEPVHIKGMMCT